MHTQTTALFCVGAFQVPLLLHFFKWVTRGTGQFDIELTRLITGILGGSAIVALPLWLLGEIPIEANAAPGAKAWFFGLMFGCALTGVLEWLDRSCVPAADPHVPPGRCPYCGRFPGFANVLLLPPTKSFECSHCRKRVSVDPRRAISVFLVFVPLAIYVVGWGPPPEIPEWVIWGIPILGAVPYAFTVKIVPAEVGT